MARVECAGGAALSKLERASAGGSGTNVADLFLQQWFNLPDPAVEEALYDSAVTRQFVGIDLGHEPVPSETTLCRFRHLLEEHQPGEQILASVNLHLQAEGVAHHHRHDRGRDHPARAHVDREPGAAARSRDAPDQERQFVVFRHEGPCGSGRQDQNHPHRGRPRRRMLLTRRCCPNCCIGEELGSGAISLIAVKPK